MTETWVRTFQDGPDYSESLGGRPWHEVPLPGRLHLCRAQTRGWRGANYAERCACGAARSHAHGRWAGRNRMRGYSGSRSVLPSLSSAWTHADYERYQEASGALDSDGQWLTWAIAEGCLAGLGIDRPRSRRQRQARP